MGVQNDFQLWERELGDLGEAAESAPPAEPVPAEPAPAEPAPPDEPAPPAESTGNRAVVVAAVLLVTGCALLIVLGQVLLGAAALALSAVILTLWRVGM
jgi:hypothetical protein